MNPLFNDQQIALLERGYMADQAMRQQNQPKQKPKKKRNFWLDQISTGLGTAGAIGGGILGAAAGGIGAVPGAAVGGGAGSALGEAIENLIDPSSGDWGNVAEEGALGAVFGAGPLKLGKAALGARTALKTGAATGLKQAAQMGSKEAAEWTLRGAAGKKALGAADTAITKQFKLNPSQLTNFAKKHGEDATKLIKRYGINAADDVASKGIQPLQQAFDDVVTRIPGVSKQQLGKNLESVWKPLVNSPNLSEQTLGKQLQAQADELIKRSGDTVDATEVNRLRKGFDDFVNYTQRGTPEHNVNKMTADALRKTLQSAADKAGIGYQGKTFKEIGRDLSKLYDLDDVLGRQANLGRGSNPLTISSLLGGAAGGAGGGPVGGAVMMGGTAFANSNLGRQAIRKGTEKAGEKLVQAGASAASKQMTPLRTAGRMFAGSTGAKTLEDALMGQSFANTDTQTTMPSMTNMDNTANITEQYSDTPEMSSPYGRENLLMDIQRDPKNADKYMEYYAMMQEIFNPAAEEQKPLSQGQQERSDLIQALDNTESLMAGGSINYGPIGSRVEGLKSMFNAADPETLAFKNTVSGLRAAITKARAGASLTAGELKLLDQYTPKDTDSEQVVRSKLQQLRSLYGYSRPTGGASTLEDALMQYQGAR